MNAMEEVDAVVLLRAGRGRQDLARRFGAMQGVSRVDRVRGPYDFVILAAGRAQVETIARVPGVTAAEVCWRLQGSHRGSG
jgi:hypothetical protein